MEWWLHRCLMGCFHACCFSYVIVLGPPNEDLPDAQNLPIYTLYYWGFCGNSMGNLWKWVPIIWVWIPGISAPAMQICAQRQTFSSTKPCAKAISQAFTQHVPAGSMPRMGAQQYSELTEISWSVWKPSSGSSLAVTVAISAAEMAVRHLMWRAYLILLDPTTFVKISEEKPDGHLAQSMFHPMCQSTTTAAPLADDLFFVQARNRFHEIVT